MRVEFTLLTGIAAMVAIVVVTGLLMFLVVETAYPW